MRTFLIRVVCGAIGISYYLTRKLEVPKGEGPEYQILPKVAFDQHQNKHFLTKQLRTIGIIGGGPSGLITAKTLSQQGYQVEVLEKKSHFGGVWFDNYEGAGLQAPYPHFNIPDHEFPPDTPMLPKQDRVLEFFDQYVQKFHIRNCITLNAEVLTMSQNEDGTWVVQLANGVKKQYDFLVLCTGMYHKPYIPHVPGLPSFQGKILHSSELKKAQETCAGKRVIVIGGQKSAFDIMNLAFESGCASVTGLMRERLWAVPQFPILGCNAGTLMVNRFATAMLPPSYTEPSMLEYLFLPISRLYWWLLARELSNDLPAPLKPTVDLRTQTAVDLMNRDEQFFGKLKRGDVPIITGPVDAVTPEGVVTKGKLLPADVLIFATGFEKNFLGLQDEEDGMWLYRSVLIPGMTNFATIGFSHTNFLILTCNLQAVWLSEVLRGAVHLPSHEDMKNDVEARKRHVRSQFSHVKRSFSWVGQHLFGLLLKDMGVQERRAESWAKHWFYPPDPLDYKLVVTHRV